MKVFERQYVSESLALPEYVLMSLSKYLSKHRTKADADLTENNTPGQMEKICARFHCAEWDVGMQIHAKLLLARGDGNRGVLAGVEDDLIVRVAKGVDCSKNNILDYSEKEYARAFKFFFETNS